MELSRNERLLVRMRIPKLYFNCSFDQIPEDCPHKSLVISYLSEFSANLNSGLGLLLWGPHSTGKTALATMLLRALPLGKTGFFMRADHVAAHYMKETSFDSEQTHVERMLAVDLLVLDELILHSGETFRDTVVEMVIRERLGNLRATLCTTNLGPDILQVQYPALCEVLKEAMFPVKVYGHNFRQDKSNEIRERFLNGSTGSTAIKSLADARVR